VSLPLIVSLDEVLLQAETSPPQKVLFYGEGAGEISSYVAGWMASKGIDVIVLDGANGFNPYRVSSLARKVWIPPESLLRRIRIARDFTCYQMAALMEERLTSLLKQEPEIAQPQVVILGPTTTFLDEDVSEREVRPLFERSLRKMEEMASGGTPFFLFQPVLSGSPPFAKGGYRQGYDIRRVKGCVGSKRPYLMKRLFQFSNLIWKIRMNEEEPKMILEKGFNQNGSPRIENRKKNNRFEMTTRIAKEDM